MSLISEALKTAQRERSERIGVPPAQRDLVEGFFPIGRTVESGPSSRRAVAVTLGIVAVVVIGAAGVLRFRSAPSRDRVKSVSAPVAANSGAAPSAVTSPPPSAPTTVSSPADVGPIAARSDPSATPGDSARVAAPTPAPASDGRSSRAASTAAAPDPTTRPLSPSTKAPAATAGDSAAANKPPAPPAAASPAQPPVSRTPIEITIEGGARRPVDRLAYDALVAQRQGNFDRAQELYERAIAGSPTADVFNNYGVLLLQRGDTAAAVLMYRRAVKLDPDKIEAWANLGDALDARGIHAEATSAFQQVLKLDPGNVRARIQLAAQYTALGALGEARRILEELTRSAPKDPAGHYALATLLVQQRDVPAALREFEQFLQLAPGVYDLKTIDAVKAYVATIRPRP